MESPTAPSSRAAESRADICASSAAVGGRSSKPKTVLRIVPCPASVAMLQATPPSSTRRRYSPRLFQSITVPPRSAQRRSWEKTSDAETMPIEVPQLPTSSVVTPWAMELRIGRFSSREKSE